MLVSSMDQVNYYALPKDGYLDDATELETYTMSPPGLEMDMTLPMMNLNMGMMSSDDLQAYNEENSPKNGTKSSLYKTELCKRFSEFGSCRYGAKCQFAHGIAELRHVVRHPKYKTTKCKSYWGSGHCPYGSRCRFIHEETESLTPQPQFSPPPPSLLSSSSPSPYAGLAGPVAVPSNNYLFDPEASSMSPFQKEYAPLPPFEKSASAPWGLGGPSRGQTRLAYAGDVYRKPSSSMGPSPSAMPTRRSDEQESGASYPDLQDAIDALVQFSISPKSQSQTKSQLPTSNAQSQPKPRPRSLDSISPTIDASSTKNGNARSLAASGSGSTTASSEFSLEGDDLWSLKHFPTLSSDETEFEHEWPAGVSLSLEATGLFGSSDESEKDKKDKDDTSPRLSVFERFH